ncbi:MAG: asparagine synthase C-terminal domain-containing protein [Cyanobacteria bacterium P01_F01_bin.150]
MNLSREFSNKLNISGTPQPDKPWGIVGYWGNSSDTQLNQRLHQQSLEKLRGLTAKICQSPNSSYGSESPIIQEAQDAVAYGNSERSPFWAVAKLHKPTSSSNMDVQRSPFWAINPATNAPLDNPKDHRVKQVIAQLSASGLDHSPDLWIGLGADNSLVWERSIFGRMSLYWMQQGTILWFASQLQYLLPLLEIKLEAKLKARSGGRLKDTLEDGLEERSHLSDSRSCRQSGPRSGLLGQRKIDPAALYGYACFSYVPTPLTPIQGIQSVPAGVRQQHRWQQDGTLITETQQPNQWHVPNHQIDDEEIAVQQLQTLLKQAVLRQLELLPSEPVGVFLSGGLDSSVVAALLVQAGVSVRAYSLDFEDDKTSELPYAQRVAEYLDIPLVAIKVGPKEVRRAIAATAQALDMPFGDSVTVPLFLLNQAAAKDVSVVFNGENGDQLFAGWTNKPLIAAGLYNLVSATASETFAQQYLKTFHRLHGYESQAFTAEVKGAIAQIDPLQWLYSSLGQSDERRDKSDGESDDRPNQEPLLHRLRRATLLLKGAQNIQPRATQLAFAHGLRVRSPFCDPELTQWTFSLSEQLYLRGTCEKYILKQAVAQWLPEDIVWREKRGMGVPLTLWCFNQLWSDLGRWLNPSRLREDEIWQSQFPEQLVSGQLGSIRGRRIGEILWLLVMWQQWRQHVLGESTPRYSFDHPFWIPQWFWKTLRRHSDND